MNVMRALVDVSASGWGAIALKATLAMLVVLLLVRATRRASASLRHLMVAATFGVVLLLPLAAAVMPAKIIKVEDRRSRLSTVETKETGQAGVPVLHKSRIPAMEILSTVYVVGAAFLGISLLAGIWRVQRMHRDAEVCVNGTRFANEMARERGLPGGIEVALTPELAVPITFGMQHPVILLPDATKEWSEDELARAVRHEVEHIARGDWFTQLIARLGCALYWPHPFVWVLWQRLRLEAERACDDAVVRSGVAPDSYAQQLVTLAKRVMGRGAVPVLAMATRSNLGVRVDAILDRRRRRAPLTRLSSAMAIVIATAIMLAAAPFQLMSATLDMEAPKRERSIDDETLNMALLMAAARGDRSTITRLLDRGADADAVIRGDGSPLIAAAKSGQIGAMQMLIDAGADVNRGVTGDGNPLINAAKHGHLDAVQLLLDEGARIDEGVIGDGNALIMAAGAGELEVVRYLLDRGATIDEVVPGDENALIHASESGQAEVVRYLIGRGADVHKRVWVEFGDGTAMRSEYRSALSQARRNGREDVIRVLLAAGATR